MPCPTLWGENKLQAQNAGIERHYDFSSDEIEDEKKKNPIFLITVKKFFIEIPLQDDNHQRAIFTCIYKQLSIVHFVVFDLISCSASVNSLLFFSSSSFCSLCCCSILSFCNLYKYYPVSLNVKCPLFIEIKKKSFKEKKKKKSCVRWGFYTM